MGWYAVLHEDIEAAEVVGWYPSLEQADAIVSDLTCDAPFWVTRISVLHVDLDRWVVERLPAVP